MTSFSYAIRISDIADRTHSFEIRSCYHRLVFACRRERGNWALRVLVRGLCANGDKKREETSNQCVTDNARRANRHDLMRVIPHIVFPIFNTSNISRSSNMIFVDALALV